MKKVSPLKNKPRLRSPGHSLQYQIGKNLAFLVFGLLCPCMLGLGFFLRGLIDFSFSPYSFVISLILIGWMIGGFCYVKFRLGPRVEQLLMGRDGEIAAGEALEELRVFGWKIFHDFEYEYGKSKKANIDHIVVAPQGVFLIETKTVAKIENDGGGMLFDGKQMIFKNTGKSIPLPVEQVEAAAKHLSGFLFQRLGLKIDVKKVVVYPGWYITWEPGCNISTAPIWACPPCYVRSRIQTENEVLTPINFDRICIELDQATRIR